MLFSSSCEYGIRAMTYLARRENQGPALVREIADEEDVPRHYLAKILQQLAAHGLVRSTKGPGGGFALNVEADRLTVQQIVDVLEPGQATRRCILGLADCSDEAPCPLHEAWSELRDRFFARLQDMTLAEMAQILEEKRARAGG